MRLESLRASAALGLLLASSAGCSSAEDGRPTPSERGPVSEAYAALTKGEVARASELTAALDARVEQAPEEGMPTFYSGLIRLWRFAEGAPNPELQPASEMTTIVERISHSRSFLPNDARVPGFLGLSQTLLAMFTADAAIFEAADRTLADSIEMLPAYGYFLRATSKGYSPRIVRSSRWRSATLPL